jgi:hypothetical protein
MLLAALLALALLHVGCLLTLLWLAHQELRRDP